MRRSQFIAIIMLIIVAWGSLFYTVLHLNDKSNKLLAQNNSILTAEGITQKDLDIKVSGLQKHIDCLFNLATQPNHNSSYIADAATCQIATPSKFIPAMTAPPTQTITPSSPSSSAHDIPASTPTTQPSHPLICTFTLKLIGCKE